MKHAAYLAVNPMGKVPAIVHNGKAVTECAAICAYLADAFPEAGLAPAPADRADYYRWMFFPAGPVEQAIPTQNSRDPTRLGPPPIAHPRPADAPPATHTTTAPGPALLRGVRT